MSDTATYLANEPSRLTGMALQLVTRADSPFNSDEQEWAAKALDAMTIYTPSRDKITGRPRRDIVDWAVGYARPAQPRHIKEDMVGRVRQLLVDSAANMTMRDLASV